MRTFGLTCFALVSIPLLVVAMVAGFVWGVIADGWKDGREFYAHVHAAMVKATKNPT